MDDFCSATPQRTDHRPACRTPAAIHPAPPPPQDGERSQNRCHSAFAESVRIRDGRGAAGGEAWRQGMGLRLDRSRFRPRRVAEPRSDPEAAGTDHESLAVDVFPGHTMFSPSRWGFFHREPVLQARWRRARSAGGGKTGSPLDDCVGCCQRDALSPGAMSHPWPPLGSRHGSGWDGRNGRRFDDAAKAWRHDGTANAAP